MRRELTLLLLALLAHEARAQFDPFTWTLKGNPSGWGFATANLLHVTGPDGPLGCQQGSSAWLETVAPYPATISVLVDYTTLDSPCDVFDAPAWFIDGESFKPDGYTFCAGTYAL